MDDGVGDGFGFGGDNDDRFGLIEPDDDGVHDFDDDHIGDQREQRRMPVSKDETGSAKDEDIADQARLGRP